MKISVLDHGYVEFIEAWGNGRHEEGSISTNARGTRLDYEKGIIEAARQSTQGSFRGWDAVPCNCRARDSLLGKPHDEDCLAAPGDKRLLTHLYENDHNTPFEFAGMVIEVQAPIFVFREWHRHRTQSYNEMSARYTPLPDLYYHIGFDQLMDRVLAARKETNKQSGAVTTEVYPDSAYSTWLMRDHQLTAELEAHYQAGLKIGVPKELARKKMPVDHYSRMRACANLRNWLAFMTLRCDSKAQWETRQFALAVQSIVEKIFPRTWALWAANL